MADYTKTSNEVKNYTVDWADETTDVSDTIDSSGFVVPTGITKDDDSNSTTTATIWLSGGRHGVTYVITNQVVTVGGKTLEQSFTVEIDDYPSVA